MNSAKSLSLLFLFTTLFTFAQDSQTLTLLATGNLSFSFDKSDKPIRGNPYIIDDFAPARVSADNDKIFNLRYNAVTDQMEVQSDKNTVQAINKNINGVTIAFLKEDKTYEVINYINENGIAERGYFIHVNNSHSGIKLLLKESKKFIERQPARNSYSDTKPAHFKRVDDVYYIIIKNKTAQVLPGKKKEILKLFPDNADEISTYIKTNKIKTSKEADLIKLINYINTL